MNRKILIGQRGAPSYPVVDTSALFVGQSTGVLSLYSLATTPVLAGNLSGLGTITCVSRSGNYAFVATSTAGIRIVDVSEQAAPSLSATLSVQTNISWLKVVGTKLYYSSANVLYVYDISTPTSPSLLGSYSGTTLTKFEVVGNYMYHQQGGFVRKVDVSNPASMSLTASLATLWPNGHNIGVIAGSYLFIAGLYNPLIVNRSCGHGIVDLSTFTMTYDSYLTETSSNYFTSQGSSIGVDYALYNRTTTTIPGGVSTTNKVIDTATTTYSASSTTALSGYNGCGYESIIYSMISGGLSLVDVSNPASTSTVGTLTLASISCVYAG